MFLLDTDVISLLSPTRIDANQAFLKWLTAEEARSDIVLSSVTIHELEKGVSLLAAKGAVTRADALKRWLDGLVESFGHRIHPLDAKIARLSGQLEARAISAGHAPGSADAIVAGTAKFLGAVVVTRNTKHFRPFGVDVLNPADLR